MSLLVAVDPQAEVERESGIDLRTVGASYIMFCVQVVAYNYRGG